MSASSTCFGQWPSSRASKLCHQDMVRLLNASAPSLIDTSAPPTIFDLVCIHPKLATFQEITSQDFTSYRQRATGTPAHASELLHTCFFSLLSSVIEHTRILRRSLHSSLVVLTHIHTQTLATLSHTQALGTHIHSDIYHETPLRLLHPAAHGIRGTPIERRNLLNRLP